MKKEYVQYGKSLIIIQVVVMLACFALFFMLGTRDPLPAGILIFVAVTFALTLLSFYKLTITIDDTYLSFSLGIGLIRKSYLLSGIQSCTPVKNPVLAGLGIHMTSGGWLYNVSGPYAIQLKFRDNTSEVRIGTDRPDEIAEEVTKRLGLEAVTFSGEAPRKRGFNIFVIILPVVIIGAILMVIWGAQDTKYITGSDSFTIKGMYGLTIPYSDIMQADTLNEMPPIKMRTNGFAAGDALKGHFRLRNGDNVLLFISSKKPPFLKIKTSTRDIYINSSLPGESRTLFSGILDHVKHSD